VQSLHDEPQLVSVFRAAAIDDNAGQGSQLVLVERELPVIGYRGSDLRTHARRLLGEVD
jgi:hypothetical protein